MKPSHRKNRPRNVKVARALRARARTSPATVPATCPRAERPGLLCHELLAAARAAAARAYCPYSRFAVGAALLADDGRIFTGANVENASYGLTVCAERAAVLQAVNAGARRFRALAIVTGSRTPATPCGACRQVLAEFCDDRLPVFCGTRTGASVKRTTLGNLLPQAFRLKTVGCRL